MPNAIIPYYKRETLSYSNRSLIIRMYRKMYVYCVCNKYYISRVLRGSELRTYFLFFACNAIKRASYMINRECCAKCRCDYRILIIRAHMHSQLIAFSRVLCCVSAAKESERRRRPKRHRATAEQPRGKYNLSFIC